MPSSYAHFAVRSLLPRSQCAIGVAINVSVGGNRNREGGESKHASSYRTGRSLWGEKTDAALRLSAQLAVWDGLGFTEWLERVLNLSIVIWGVFGQSYAN